MGGGGRGASSELPRTPGATRSRSPSRCPPARLPRAPLSASPSSVPFPRAGGGTWAWLGLIPPPKPNQNETKQNKTRTQLNWVSLVGWVLLVGLPELPGGFLLCPPSVGLPAPRWLGESWGWGGGQGLNQALAGPPGPLGAAPLEVVAPTGPPMGTSGCWGQGQAALGAPQHPQYCTGTRPERGAGQCESLGGDEGKW